ncbi:hypothetical protein ABBQ32_006253 [Trebouxia sp. C0010 RCD-2024]
MEGTFGSDGELKKTGPSDVKTAEGLGGSNIKGVGDPKTKQDAEADTGKAVPKQHISNNTYPRVGTDPASSESVVIDAPESGRTNQGQGNNTSSGREDYIDLSRQGAK